MNPQMAALAVILLAILVLPVVLVIRCLARRDAATGKKRRAAGVVAVLLLAEGVALAAIGFFGIVLEAGPELRGGDGATIHVLQGLLVAGIVGTGLGLALGIVALVQRASRARQEGS